MDWPQRCAAVIPCFNEAGEIARVVAAIKEILPAVIVVDDGSIDGTAQRAKAAGAEILRLERNSGKGAALRAGWLRARARNFEWVLMLDGDGQHCAGDLPKFFESVERSGARLVVGSRNMDKIPRVRRWVNRLMSREISRLAGMHLPDTQCGFRMAELEMLMELPPASEHFEIESDMLLVAARSGRKISYVPIQTIYKNSTSKIRPVRDTIRWLRWRLAQSKAMSSTLWKETSVDFLPLPLTGRGTEGEG